MPAPRKQKDSAPSNASAGVAKMSIHEYVQQRVEIFKSCVAAQILHRQGELVNQQQEEEL
jgi:hypothetical protein